MSSALRIAASLCPMLFGKILLDQGAIRYVKVIEAPFVCTFNFDQRGST